MKPALPESTRRFGAASFVGGQLCLDFANTVDNWLAPQPGEKLACPADWFAWCVGARLISEAEARSLQRAAQQSATTARAHLERVQTLRNAVHAVVRSSIEKRAPSRADLATVDAAIAAAHVHRQIVFAGGKFASRWNADDSFDRLLWPIAASAEDLLLDPELLGRLNQCPAEDCGWVFLDTSKNRSRRWCSMRTCGNLAKAHRHHARVRRERTE